RRENRSPAHSFVRRRRRAYHVTRAVALCLACWACGAGAPERVALLYRADDTTAQLEDRLLGPYCSRHPGLRVVPRDVAGSRFDYRRRLATALAQEPPPTRSSWRTATSRHSR